MKQTETATDHDSAAMPTWLRERFADAIAAARRTVEAEARRTGQPLGVIADQRIRAILDGAKQGRVGNPSEATAAAYGRDHARLLNEQQTPLDKATTFQHHNRLRSAFRFCEEAAIVSQRREAERARRAKDTEDMSRLTWAAFERAVVFDMMFLAHDRPTWGEKAAALRAAGVGAGEGKSNSKSKRAAGRRAPTPDALLVALTRQMGRASRVEVPALCFALFGVRPAELLKGARLLVNGDAVSLVVSGAKVDATRGQKVRILTVAASRTESALGFGQSLMAVQVLRDAVAAGRDWVQLSDADLVAVRRAMREVQEGLSPYAYRHARASDAKASGDRAMVAAWLGHRSDRTQSGYGNARSSSGAVGVKAAKASAPIRAVKTLPQTLAQRLAQMDASRHAKTAARRGAQPATGVSQKRKGPRLR